MSENKFTIVRNLPNSEVKMIYGVESWDIDNVAYKERTIHGLIAKRGSKTTIQRSLQERDGLKIHQVIVTTRNQAGTPVASSVILAESSEVPRKHQHVLGSGNLICQCGSELWHYNGRSLFSYNLICAGCNHEAHPLTETGAST